MAHKTNELRKELSSLSAEELRGRLAEEKRTLFTLRYQKEVHPFENTMRIRQVRKTIARLHTYLRAILKTTEGS